LKNSKDRQNDPEQPSQECNGEQLQSQSQANGGNGHPGKKLKQMKICSVCGEPVNPGDDSGDSDADSHPACRDMDASFL
jgi:hypothetical protein